MSVYDNYISAQEEDRTARVYKIVPKKGAKPVFTVGKSKQESVLTLIESLGGSVTLVTLKEQNAAFREVYLKAKEEDTPPDG